MPSTLECGEVFAINNGRVFCTLHIHHEEVHSSHGHQPAVAAYPCNNKSCAGNEQKQIQRETEIHMQSEKQKQR